MTASHYWLLDRSTRPELAQAVIDQMTQAGLVLVPYEPERAQRSGLILIDQPLPSVLDLLHALRLRQIDRVIVCCLVDLATDYVWALVHAGAADVVTPDSFAGQHADTDIARLARACAARFDRWRRIDDVLDSPLVTDNLIGRSPAWLSTVRQTIEAVLFGTSNILIHGETGTGKELLASLVHALDEQRRKKELILVDCTTLNPEIAGSELFGHEKGAYTGAISSRDGAFALADGGTLFLDEVGELPITLQPKLLRVIQEKAYRRVGSSQWRKTDVRLVCATHRDLEDDVAKGAFRSDLYYRIRGASCALPPLRDRADDVLPLARHFMRTCRTDGELPELSGPVQRFLQAHPFPGNVRQLRSIVGRFMQRHAGSGAVTIGDIAPEDRMSPGAGLGVAAPSSKAGTTAQVTHSAPASAEWGIPDDAASEAEAQDPGDTHHALARVAQMLLSRGHGLRDIRQRAEEAAIAVALRDSGGSLQLAARRLGVTDRALQLRQAEKRRDTAPG